MSCFLSTVHFSAPEDYKGIEKKENPFYINTAVLIQNPKVVCNSGG